MAASSLTRCAMQSLNRVYSSFIKSGSRTVFWGRFLSSTGGDGSTLNKDPEQLFIRPDVQVILSKITGFNLEKIFRERQTDTDVPKYRLLTDDQLQDYQEEAMRHGRERLQMPPVKKSWSTDHSAESQIISADSDIAGFDASGCRYIFTDISYGLPNRHRVVVVREPNGTLRLADHKERDRTLQVYFPRSGRMYNMPKMFEEESIEKILVEGRYEYVLDRACVQFEPDDPDYIRVTNRTYEHVASNARYDDLRSTRHFGPMALYFAVHHKIDGLLADMIRQDLLDDAHDLIRLYHIVHPDCVSAREVKKQNVTDAQNCILLFTKHDAVHGGIVELALQSYNEIHGPGRRNSTMS